MRAPEKPVKAEDFMPSQWGKEVPLTNDEKNRAAAEAWIAKIKSWGGFVYAK